MANTRPGDGDRDTVLRDGGGQVLWGQMAGQGQVFSGQEGEEYTDGYNVERESHEGQVKRSKEVIESTSNKHTAAIYEVYLSTTAWSYLPTAPMNTASIISSVW